MSTTQITNISHLLDLTAYAGEFLDDFDMEAVRSDFLDQLNADLVDGVTVYANGDVIAEDRMAGIARELDWKAIVDGIDPAPYFERHDVTARLEDLPAGVHGEVLTGRHVETHSAHREVVLWADRACTACPRCAQPVQQQTECPVLIDDQPGGTVQDVSQQHGCGEWLAVAYRLIEAPVDVVTIESAAAELVQMRDDEINDLRARVRNHLMTDLRAALDRLAAPLDDDETAEDRAEEVRTGDEVEPGVFRQHDGGWLVWAYDPAGLDEEGITVHAADLGR